MSFPDDKDFNQREMECLVIATFVLKRNLSHNLYALVSSKKTMSFPDDKDFNQRKMGMFGNS